MNICEEGNILTISCDAVLFSNGRILCWGDNTGGLAGINNIRTPVGDPDMRVSTMDFIEFSDTLPAIQIHANNAICGLFSNRRVRCWGANDAQQLGDTTSLSRGSSLSVTTTVFVSFLASIDTIPIASVSVGK